MLIGFFTTNTIDTVAISSIFVTRLCHKNVLCVYHVLCYLVYDHKIELILLHTTYYYVNYSQHQLRFTSYSIYMYVFYSYACNYYAICRKSSFQFQPRIGLQFAKFERRSVVS